MPGAYRDGTAGHGAHRGGRSGLSPRRLGVRDRTWRALDAVGTTECRTVSDPRAMRKEVLTRLFCLHAPFAFSFFLVRGTSLIRFECRVVLNLDLAAKLYCIILTLDIKKRERLSFHQETFMAEAVSGQLTNVDNDQHCTGHLEVDGQAVFIRNDQAFWSIDRRTYDIQRKAIDSQPSADLERGNFTWTDIKSFDRVRDSKTLESIEDQDLEIAPSTTTDKAFNPKKTAILSLAALGIVYGDIGTSPLYTVQSIYATIPVDERNLIGGISTVFWLITVVVTFKYIVVVMRANNRGEGGVMVLTAMACQSTHQTTAAWWKGAVMMLGNTCVFRVLHAGG
jgi:hypothetical protein